MEIKIGKARANIGLKISDEEIMVFAMSRSFGGQINVLLDKKIELPKGVVRNSLIVEEEKLLACLETAMSDLDKEADIKQVINFAIPENLVYYENFSFNPEKATVEEVIKRQINKLPFREEELIFRHEHYLVNEKTNEHRMFLFALEKSAFEEWNNFFQKHNIPVSSFSLEAKGNYTALFDIPAQEDFVIIDFAEEHFNIQFFSKQHFLFAYTEKNLHINKEAGKEGGGDEIEDILVEKVIREIRGAEKNYSILIKKIFLLGKKIPQDLFVKKLEDKLSLPVKRKEILIDKIMHDWSKSVVAGLSLDSLRMNENKSMSFLIKTEKSTQSYFDFFRHIHIIIPLNLKFLFKKNKFVSLGILVVFLLMISVLIFGSFQNKQSKQIQAPQFLSELTINIPLCVVDFSDDKCLVVKSSEYLREEAVSQEELINLAAAEIRKKMSDTELFVIKDIQSSQLIFPIKIQYLYFPLESLNKYLLEQKLISETFSSSSISKLEIIRDNEDKIFELKIIAKSNQVNSELKVLPQIEDYFQQIKIKPLSQALNVRSGPGLNFSVLGKVQSGEMYPFLEEKDAWAAIIDKNNKKVWISTAFAEKIEENN